MKWLKGLWIRITRGSADWLTWRYTVNQDRLAHTIAIDELTQSARRLFREQRNEIAELRLRANDAYDFAQYSQEQVDKLKKQLAPKPKRKTSKTRGRRGTAAKLANTGDRSSQSWKTETTEATDSNSITPGPE